MVQHPCNCPISGSNDDAHYEEAFKSCRIEPDRNVFLESGLKEGVGRHYPAFSAIQLLREGGKGRMWQSAITLSGSVDVKTLSTERILSKNYIER